MKWKFQHLILMRRIKMDIKTLTTNFPKSVAALKKWGAELLKEQQLKVIEAAPEPFKEAYRKAEPVKFTDDMLEGFIAFYPRRLLDFFDAQGIYMSIKHSSVGFSWDLDGEHDPWPHEQTRQEAEIKAFTKAFEILEQKA